MNPNDVTLLKSAFILLIAGMGMTFVFLIIQIFCTNAFSVITKKFSYLVPEPEPKKPAKKAAAPAAASANTEEIIAAVAAAIHQASK